MSDDTHVDLIVLGAGAAGMMTALLAARRGMRVMVIDPAFSQPNNLFISGGLFPAAGSSLQRAAGVTDSPQAWLEDLDRFAGDAVNRPLAVAVAQALPKLIDFLVQECAAPIQFLPDVPAPGHRVARFHAVVPASGRALHAWLRQAIAHENNIVCVTDVPLPAPSDSPGGWSLELVSAGASHQRVTSAHLLLAGGGFGANSRMVAQHIPQMQGALHSGAASSDGTCIALGQRWGTALSGMDGYQGQGHTHPPGATRLGMSLPMLGAIMVNRAGQRFVREDVGPSALAAHVLAQPGQLALEVFDAHIEQQVAAQSAYRDALAAGRILPAGSVQELANVTGVAVEALAQTLAQCAVYWAGAADPLGRRNFARVLGAPFRASWVTGALAHTQGGLSTDAQARVLNASGEVIPRLYAAGGCAAGLSGKGGEAYLPGNGLAQSFGLAWLAVRSICEINAGDDSA